MKPIAKTNSILSLLLIKIGIIIAVLLIAGFVNLRLDLSKGRVYSLSPVSKQAVRGLKDRLIIKIYASEELPTNFIAVDRYLKDLLAEYKNYGGRNFSYEYAKTSSAEELEAIATQNGFSGFSTQSMENDRIVLNRTVFSLTMEYQGKREILNLPPGIESKLEYSLTNKIRRLSAANLPVLVVFRDSTYSSYPTESLEKSLDENYRLGSADLTRPIPAKHVMLFTGVSDSLSTEQLYNLDQYLMSGGKLVMLQDRISLNETAPYLLNSNIFNLLESYGIKLGTDMVLDLLCQQMQGGIGQPTSPVPFVPLLRGSTKNVITKDMKDIMFLLASEITTTDSASVKIEPILQTSTSSAKIPGPDFNIDPRIIQNPDPGFYNLSPMTLGAVITGKFRSYFADDPVYSKRPGFIAQNPKAEMVLYGDRELIMDANESEFSNRHFVILNAVDYLRKDLSMINIRSRTIQGSMLDVKEFMYRKDLLWGDAEKTANRIKLAVKIVSIVVPPLLMIILGMIFYQLYKRRSGATQ
ncbi:MAG TPA: Gldg family protein [Candidatus Cloacimonadota bacterium]|nr:Gldg family protein [Candidatus Cloacimonadota bacterium]